MPKGERHVCIGAEIDTRLEMGNSIETSRRQDGNRKDYPRGRKTGEEKGVSLSSRS